GLSIETAALRRERARAAYVGAHVAVPPWQASQDLCRQAERARRQHAAREEDAPRPGARSRRPARRAAEEDLQQCRPGLEPRFLLGIDDAQGRWRSAQRRARASARDLVRRL